MIIRDVRVVLYSAILWMFVSFITTIRTRARLKSWFDVGKYPEYITILTNLEI